MRALNSFATQLPTSQHDLLFLASLASFPPCFGADRLSELIGKSVAAILADRSRAPHKLPPACTPPGTRQPIWLLVDVLVWLANHREAAALPPQPRPAPKPRSSVSHLGRPGKKEKAEADRLGISIKTLRAREALRESQNDS